MEREAFEDAEVAALLNRGFIAIKVDREERPDVDAVYMRVCQAMTGAGGWPLTILMTPEKNPFFAATYIPKHARYGQRGLMELLPRVEAAWAGERQGLWDAAEQITATVANSQGGNSMAATPADREPVKAAFSQFKSEFDEANGGFGHAPKFPMPHTLLFLLRYHLHTQEEAALHMVEKTLECMWRGGIFDHIGGGFSRYSTDEKWLAPHFEKMLYDNALLTIAYLEGYQATDCTQYLHIAERILSYVQREMTSPEGGFYSAQDADSEGVEGKYYTFAPKEIYNVLGKDAGEHFCRYYDITAAGNFEGCSIPNLITNPTPGENAPSPESLQRLYAYRLKRTALHKDDKTLTAWNSLMIAAFAKAYIATGNNSYLAAAEGAYEFIGHALFKGNALSISWRAGKASGRGLLDDYAFLCFACLSLYDATYSYAYAAHALALADDAMGLFADAAGGYFLAPTEGGSLPFLPKETYDGALPSGNCVFAHCLNRIAKLTGEQRWNDAADAQAAFLMPFLCAMPQGHAFGLMALMDHVYPAKELVCVFQQEEDKHKLISALGKQYLPNITVWVKLCGQEAEAHALCPALAHYTIPAGESSAYYICESMRCQAPVFRLEDALQKLN